VSNIKWVVRTSEAKALLVREIPQLMKDLEGSSYESYCSRTGEKVGWRQLLAERMHYIDPSTLADSYIRRVYSLIKEAYPTYDAHFVDVMCVALGLNMSEHLTTYPNSVAACKEQVEVEYELAGHKLDKETVEKVATRRLKRYQQELYPDGKRLTPYQQKVREYDRKKRSKAA
jgi:hypothetical protein